MEERSACDEEKDVGVVWKRDVIAVWRRDVSVTWRRDRCVGDKKWLWCEGEMWFWCGGEMCVMEERFDRNSKKKCGCWVEERSSCGVKKNVVVV